MKNPRVRSQGSRPIQALVDALEPRVLLSVSQILARGQFKSLAMKPARVKWNNPPRATAPIHVGKRPVNPSVNSSSTSFTPSQILHAYGFDQVSFALSNGGAGQTIAIIGAYDSPTALTDLQHFDAQYGLPDPPSFKRLAQDGSTNYPSTDPAGPGNGTWALEADLDIQWAHAIAPAASIVLIEARDNTYDNLFTGAVGLARTLPGISVISMSFGGGEFGSELTYDSLFSTPSGHTPITFVAATGDNGAPGNYPAFSSNALAVGATSLTLDNSGNYQSESAWSGSGGGFSFIVGQPTYQKGIAAQQSVTRRTTPDVSIVGDPNTGAIVYDSYDYPRSPWRVVGGTSLSAPLWAGLIAIADQGRVSEGLTTLDGRNQTLPLLYSMPSSNFHDVTTGSTTGSTPYAATAGYDLATGRGSPVANRVIYGLMGSGSISGSVFQDNNSNQIADGTDHSLAGVRVYVDSNNNGVYDPGTITTVANNTASAIPDNNTLGTTSSVSVSGTSAAVSNISVTLNITHPRDSDLSAYLIAPDGSEILLFSALTGVNFTNTVLNDQATQSISGGSGAFTGTFYPADALADFDGKSANGAWSLTIVDGRAGNAGTLNSWSLSITTGPTDVYSTITNASGNFSFGNLPLGAPVTIREVPPDGFTQSIPAAATGLVVTPLFAGAVGANISNFPLVFNATGNADSYTLSVDPSDTYLQISVGTSNTSPPAYLVPIANLPQLTFNLLGNDSVLVLDFSNGSPLPVGSISLNMVTDSDEELRVLGNNPLQTFTLNDTQFSLLGGGTLLYQSIPNLTLTNCTVNASGDLNGLNNVNVNSGATLNL